LGLREREREREREKENRESYVILSSVVCTLHGDKIKEWEVGCKFSTYENSEMHRKFYPKT
jgi:hypothetical protein